MTSPMPTGQVPGIYRKRVGDMVVTAVSDGGNPSNPAMLQNIPAEETAALLHAAGRRAPLFTAINTFLVQTAAQTVLIDTGCGGLASPTAGRMLDNLAACGVAPGDVDVVLLTHMHIDHIGGLLDGAGAPVFANADLLVPQEETAFWLDDARAAAAPEGARPSFALAKRMTAPYGARLHAFTEAEPLPGITAVKLPGHTPGHTGFMMGPEADRLLIWGDIFHAPDVQCRRPDAAVVFDIDQPLAIATRRAILARAADEQLCVAGMHLNFPAFTRIVREAGAYAMRPIAWLPEL